MDVHQDLRVVRTRKLLRAALFELTVEKGFSNVTVRDVCERAMVNRSTFYRHYLDKHDLLIQYLDELQAEIAAAAAAQMDAGTSNADDPVPAGLLMLLKRVQEQGRFFRVMLGRDGDARFTDRFRQLSRDRYRLMLSRNRGVSVNSPPDALKLEYISSASLGAILWWLENDQRITAEQLAMWLGRLNMTSASV